MICKHWPVYQKTVPKQIEMTPQSTFLSRCKHEAVKQDACPSMSSLNCNQIYQLAYEICIFISHLTLRFSYS